MGLRRLLGYAPVAALALCAWTACKDKPQPAVPDFAKRCEQLAKACGDDDKHVDKIVGECTLVAEKHVAKGCTDKATALYDCYEKELCGKNDKVWTMPDLAVLSERHQKCVAERNAALQCLGQ